MQGRPRTAHSDRYSRFVQHLRSAACRSILPPNDITLTLINRHAMTDVSTPSGQRWQRANAALAGGRSGAGWYPARLARTYHLPGRDGHVKLPRHHAAPCSVRRKQGGKGNKRPGCLTTNHHCHCSNGNRVHGDEVIL